MVKKQTLVAIALMLLVPAMTMLGGFLFSLVNPEIAAGHPNYARNFHLLTLLRNMFMLGSAGLIAISWVLVCYLLIRSKERSMWWLFLAALGPLGLAILTTVNDRTPAEMDWHARFVRKLNWFMRAGYEGCVFVIIWLVAFQAMVLKRNLVILIESASTGVSTAQIIDTQNASSGMWAFGEMTEVMYMAVVLYLIWPIAFNVMARMTSTMTHPKRAA